MRDAIHPAEIVSIHRRANERTNKDGRMVRGEDGNIVRKNHPKTPHREHRQPNKKKWTDHQQTHPTQPNNEREREKQRKRTHRIIVGLSKLIPHPCTCTSFGNPMGANISGRNMPLLPTSTHLSSSGWKAKISSDGYPPKKTKKSRVSQQDDWTRDRILGYENEKRGVSEAVKS